MFRNETKVEDNKTKYTFPFADDQIFLAQEIEFITVKLGD